MTYHQPLTQSDLFTSLRGLYNPARITFSFRRENFAFFSANGNPAFMMLSDRMHISVVIAGEKVCFQCDQEFWKNNPVELCVFNKATPKSCLKHFIAQIQQFEKQMESYMDTNKISDIALEHLNQLIQACDKSGYPVDSTLLLTK